MRGWRLDGQNRCLAKKESKKQIGKLED